MQLVWCDVETTGLDPRKDDLLEVAVGITTLDKPFALQPSQLRSWLIEYRWDQRYWGRGVAEMHQKSGLRADLDMGPRFYAREVEAMLLESVQEVEDYGERATLSGSSVHFDLDFIKFTMPTLAARLSHRVYDVSAVKLFCRSLGMPKLPKQEQHRAAADVQESIEHARLCAQWLQNWRWRGVDE